MKRLLSLISTLICLLSFVGCSNETEKSMSYQIINFTVPAGCEEAVFASEKIYFKDGRVSVSADFENNVEIIFREENSHDNSSSVTVSADFTAEIVLEGEKWYEVGIKPDVDSEISDTDTDIDITLHDASWEQ